MVIGFFAAPAFAFSYLAGAAFLVLSTFTLRDPEPWWKAAKSSDQRRSYLNSRQTPA